MLYRRVPRTITTFCLRLYVYHTRLKISLVFGHWIRWNKRNNKLLHVTIHNKLNGKRHRYTHICKYKYIHTEKWLKPKPMNTLPFVQQTSRNGRGIMIVTVTAFNCLGRWSRRSPSPYITWWGSPASSWCSSGGLSPRTGDPASSEERPEGCLGVKFHRLPIPMSPIRNRWRHLAPGLRSSPPNAFSESVTRKNYTRI